MNYFRDRKNFFLRFAFIFIIFGSLFYILPFISYLSYSVGIKSYIQYFGISLYLISIYLFIEAIISHKRMKKESRKF